MIPYRPSAAKYGLKRDRRKLHVEPLHLPPEDSRASKYHPEAGNAPQSMQAGPTTKSSSHGVTGEIPHQPSGRSAKLGALCSPQIGNRLDF